MEEKNFYESLTISEKEIFNRYKENNQSFSHKLNNALRSDNYGEFENEIKILDGIINKNVSKEITTLYRATIESNVIPFINKNKYTNPEYLSTATDLESIEGHFTIPLNPVCIIFTCKLGTAMAPFETNEVHNGLENEMLLGRGQDFRIISNTVIEDKEKIESIMGRFYGQDVLNLRVIKVTNDINKKIIKNISK